MNTDTPLQDIAALDRDQRGGRPNTDDAYRSGVNAFKAGATVRDNPFDPGELRQAWADGWWAECAKEDAILAARDAAADAEANEGEE